MNLGGITAWVRRKLYLAEEKARVARESRMSRSEWLEGQLLSPREIEMLEETVEDENMPIQTREDAARRLELHEEAYSIHGKD